MDVHVPCLQNFSTLPKVFLDMDVLLALTTKRVRIRACMGSCPGPPILQVYYNPQDPLLSSTQKQILEHTAWASRNLTKIDQKSLKNHTKIYKKSILKANYAEESIEKH